MATLADVTRNRNILNIWSVVRRFTRGRWTEATIPTMPEIIAMLSLTELTEVTIQPGAQSPYLLQTLDKEVKHAVLVYPKGPADSGLLQNPAVKPRIAYNEETGELTFAFDALPGTLTLIINDMLANDEATTQATLLNSPLQIQGYSTEMAYTQGDIALYDDGVRKTLIVSNAPTQGEFDPTKWSILVTKDEYQPALDLITQNLQSEVERAMSAEQSLQDAVSTERTRATAAEQVLRQDIDSEVTRATAQENQIAQDLSTEAVRAAAAEQALSQSLQQEITQRQAKDIASVQYNASTNSLQHTRTDTTIVNVALPVADSNKNGLMSKQTYDQVQDIASIVSELIGKGTRRLTSAAINPEPEPTPDATWQASMNALWATASSGATPVDGDTLISTNSATLWRLATYVASSNAWVYRGADTLSIASPTQLGIVLSTQAVDNTMENGGSVFVEQGTGAMVVNGWDNMTGRITSMEAFMNRQAGFATAAQGALADTLNQTTVKITGNQSIDGVKDFVGTLKINGSTITDILDNNLALKMDKANPTGTGSFSLNRSTTGNTGEDSVAFGYNNIASGFCSEAGGQNTVASGVDACSKGSNTTASGLNSFAGGFAGVASGENSFSFGYNCSSQGNISAAFGNNTGALRKSQLVFGEFNIFDTDGTDTASKGKYIEIVGNGTSTAQRNNARTIDWDGNEVLSGHLTTQKLTQYNGFYANYSNDKPNHHICRIDATEGTGNRIISGKIYSHIGYGASDRNNDIMNFEIVTLNDGTTNCLFTITRNPNGSYFSYRLRFVKVSNYVYDVYIRVPQWSSTLVKMEAPAGVAITMDDDMENKHEITETYGCYAIDSSNPVGMIAPFWSSSVPNGWLKCEGGTFNKDDYPLLYDVLQSTTLPDLKGRFIEGINNNARYVDAGLPNITGNIYNSWGLVQTRDNRGSGALSWGVSARTSRYEGNYYNGDAITSINFNASSSNNVYGNSSTVQPKAVRMMYCIKAG